MPQVVALHINPSSKHSGMGSFTRGLTAGYIGLGVEVEPVSETSGALFRHLLEITRRTDLVAYHGTENFDYLPIPRRVRQIATLHDLLLLRHDGPAPPWVKAKGRLMVWALPLIDGVVCVSERTATALPSRVRGSVQIIQQGIDPALAVALSTPHRSIESRYILYTGGDNPRKRPEFLGPTLAAYRALGGTSRLVSTTPIPAAADHVNVRPAASAEDLAALYQNASCCVYPSLHEGFGLPVLESAAAGIPCVSGPVPAATEDPLCRGTRALPAAATPEEWAMAILEAESSNRRSPQLDVSSNLARWRTVAALSLSSIGEPASAEG